MSCSTRRRTILRAAAASLLLAPLLLLLRAGDAEAQAFVSESTPRYDVQIVIEPSGSILVTETIEQDFGSTPRHGIFRVIPDRLAYSDRYERVYPIEVVSVQTSAGTPDDVETSHEGGDFKIRVGDPDATITGMHTSTPRATAARRWSARRSRRLCSSRTARTWASRVPTTSRCADRAAGSSSCSTPTPCCRRAR